MQRNQTHYRKMSDREAARLAQKMDEIRGRTCECGACEACYKRAGYSEDEIHGVLRQRGYLPRLESEKTRALGA